MATELPPPTESATIDAILASERKFVLACTGGGSGAIAAIAQTPGASSGLLEAAVPYCEAALSDWLGATPEQACSDRTARAMAMAAWQRARRLAPDAAAAALIGVACTAGLATTRPKQGDHRVHVAVQSSELTRSAAVTLTKGARTRAEEEAVAAALVLDLLGGVCDDARADSEGTQRLLTGGEAIVCREARAPAAVAAVVAGSASWALRDEHGTWRTTAADAGDWALFPGAFNPLHDGHRKIAQLAQQRLGRTVVFELSVANVDKPPLDFVEIADRVAQFPHQPVVLTAAATFVEKARLFPGSVLVVGADTLVRIGQPRYYGDDPAARDAAIAEIARHGCRFLAFGRTDGEKFATLADLPLPPQLAALCDEVPASEFREDVSSTELRRTQ